MNERGVREEAFESEPGSEERTDPRFRDRLGDRLDSLVPETVKKLALAGLGAVFMTEEGIRHAVSDLKLPREAVSTLLSQTEKARSELFRMIAVELRRFLEDANIAGELRKVLIGLSVDVQASVSFRQSDGGGVSPKVEIETKTRPKPKPKPKREGRADGAGAAKGRRKQGGSG